MSFQKYQKDIEIVLITREVSTDVHSLSYRIASIGIAKKFFGFSSLPSIKLPSVQPSGDDPKIPGAAAPSGIRIVTTLMWGRKVWRLWEGGTLIWLSGKIQSQRTMWLCHFLDGWWFELSRLLQPPSWHVKHCETLWNFKSLILQ